jgi:hypothetical protein
MINKNDEYQIYIDEDKTIYYYKNKQLHRKNGPAIVKLNERENNKVDDDGGLYSITFSPISNKSHKLSSPDTIQIPMVGNKIKKLLKTLRTDESSIVTFTNANTAFSESLYFLDGLNYSKTEFERTILKEQAHNSSRKLRV